MTLPETLWSTQIDEDYLFSQGRAVAEYTEAERRKNVWKPTSFDEDGRLSPFSPKPSGFIDLVTSRWDRGSYTTGMATTGAQALNNLFDRTYEMPGDIVGNSLMKPDGSVVELVDATAEDVLDTVPKDLLDIYEAAGMPRSRIVDATGNDSRKYIKWHNEFVERQRNDEKLLYASQELSGLYNAAGVVAFGGDLITDPVTWLTLGTGALASAGVRGVTKVAATKVGRNLLGAAAGRSKGAREVGRRVQIGAQRFATRAKNGSPLEAALEAISPIQDRVAGRVILGTMVGENITHDIWLQHMEHDTAIRFGELEQDDTFNVDLVRVGQTALMTFAIGGLLTKYLSGAPVHSTVRELIAHNRHSAVGDHLDLLVRKQYINPDDSINVDLVSNLDRMYMVLRHDLNDTNYSAIVKRVKDNPLSQTDEGVSYLADFMSKRPNSDELHRFFNEWDEHAESGRLQQMLRSKLPDDPNRTPETEFSKAKALLDEADNEFRLAKQDIGGEVRPIAESDVKKGRVVKFKLRGKKPMEGVITEVRTRTIKHRDKTSSTELSMVVEDWKGFPVVIQVKHLREVAMEDGSWVTKSKRPPKGEPPETKVYTRQQKINQALRKRAKASRMKNEAVLRFQRVNRPSKMDNDIKAWGEASDSSPIVSANDNPENRRRRARYLLGRYAADERNSKKRHVSKLQRALQKVTFLSPTEKPNAQMSEKALAKNPLFAKLYAVARSLVDDNGVNMFVTRADGTQIDSIHTRFKKIRSMRNNVMVALDNALTKADKRNEEARRLIGKQILASMRKENPEPLDEALQPIADALSEFSEALGIRAVNAGVIDSLIEDFLPVKVIPHKILDPDTETTIVELLAKRWMERVYNPDDDSSALSIKRLKQMGIVERDPKNPDNWVVAEPYKKIYRRVPRTMKDLKKNPNDSLDGIDLDDLDKMVEVITGTPKEKPTTPQFDTEEIVEIVETYKQGLEDILLQDARNAVSRKFPKRPGAIIKQPDELGDGRPISAYENSTSVRKIEQEFWYSPEILELNVLETDIAALTLTYERGFGYEVAKQETLTEAFGEAVTFQDIVAVLKEQAKDERHLLSLLTDLEVTEQITGGRLAAGSQSEVLNTANAFVRAKTFFALGATIIPTEGAVLAARMLGRKNIRQTIDAVKIMFKHFSPAELRRAGFAYELELDESRQFGFLEEVDSLYSGSAAYRGMRKYEDIARHVGLEPFITRRLKMLHFYMSAGILDEYRGRLDSLRVLDQNFDRSTKDGEKAFRQAVKQAKMGSRYDRADQLVRFGLVSEKSINVAKEFLKRDKNILGNIVEMRKQVEFLPENMQNDARVFIEGLQRIGLEDAEAFVTTASPNSIMKSNNGVANAFLMYTSFPMAFAQRSVTRAFETRSWKGGAYMGAYLFGELATSILRDHILHGTPPEETIKNIEEDPFGALTQVMVRAPFFGPWNVPMDVATSPFTRFSGFSSGGSPGMDTLFRTPQQFLSSLIDITKGEFDADSGRRILNSIPGTNWWPARVLGASLNLDNFETDPDAVDALLYNFDLDRVNTLSEFEAQQKELNRPQPLDDQFGDDSPVPQGAVPLTQPTPPSRTFGLDAQAQPLINTDFGVSDALDFLEPDTGDDPGSVDTLG